MDYDWPRRALVQDYLPATRVNLRDLVRTLMALEELCSAHGIRIVQGASYWLAFRLTSEQPSDPVTHRRRPATST